MPSILPNERPAQVLIEAAESIENADHSPEVVLFMHAVACALRNTASRIALAPAAVSPATPARVYADVFKVAQTWLDIEEPPTLCTCGHYHRPEAACGEKCGCGR